MRRYAVRAVVLAAPPPADLPTVHQAHGLDRPGRSSGLPIEVRLVPRARGGRAWRGFARQLRAVRPDAIWVQEEPIDPFLLEMLALYRFSRRPRIVTAVCENIFPRPRRLAERTGAAAALAEARPAAGGGRALARRHPRRRHARVGARVDARRRRSRARRAKSRRWRSLRRAATSSSASPAGSSRRRAGACSSSAVVAAGDFRLALAGDGPGLDELAEQRRAPGPGPLRRAAPEGRALDLLRRARLPRRALADDAALEGAVGEHARRRARDGVADRRVGQRGHRRHDGSGRGARPRGRRRCARRGALAAARRPALARAPRGWRGASASGGSLRYPRTLRSSQPRWACRCAR